MRLALVLRPRIMSDQHPQAQVDRKVRRELRMTTRHPIALAQHLRRPLLPYIALEQPIETFAAKLAGEHDEDLQFSR